MRRTSAAISIAALAVTLAACGPTSTVKTGADQPNSPATKTAPAKSTPAKAKPTPTKTKPAGIGDTITVKGLDDGAKVSVTLVKWLDHAKGSDQFTSPDAGKRFVAAQIRVTNSGTAVYDDTPSNGMQVADNQGQRFESSIWEVSAGPSMPSEVKLRPGDKALGYVVFEVPKTSKITQLQFTADSGFANEAGQWNVH
jgi:glucose/arabinose dehydrogenase